MISNNKDLESNQKHLQSNLKDGGMFLEKARSLIP